MKLIMKVPQPAEPEARLILPLDQWPAVDRGIWVRARKGTGPEWRDNPAYSWSERTVKRTEQAYGRYLGWLLKSGLLIESETVVERLTPKRVTGFIIALKTEVSEVSVGAYMNGLNSAANALAPDANWSWPSIRATRLKLRARPSREKRQAIQHTLVLYQLGKEVMDYIRPSQDKRRTNVRPAMRYQAGLVIALLAARPLRIRNFQAITIGTSLRFDCGRYWLTFGPEETKAGGPIDEPLPDDLVPHLETFLRTWRPILLRQTAKYSSAPPSKRLWLDRSGKAMIEHTLRLTIERYTGDRFGTALWPHLFRDCLLTSVATDQPDLMKISATLLGRTTLKTGEKHYNQAHMLDASRRYGMTILELRESFLASVRSQPHGPD